VRDARNGMSTERGGHGSECACNPQQARACRRKPQTLGTRPEQACAHGFGRARIPREAVASAVRVEWRWAHGDLDLLVPCQQLGITTEQLTGSASASSRSIASGVPASACTGQLSSRLAGLSSRARSWGAGPRCRICLPARSMGSGARTTTRRPHRPGGRSGRDPGRRPTSGPAPDRRPRS